MVRKLSCLALGSLVFLPIGLAHAQSSAATSGATQTTRGYGGQAPLQSLSRLDEPERELGAASVRDSSGRTVGQVQAVETSAKGKAQSVRIALNTAKGVAMGRRVSVPAQDLRYDSASN